ncbi:MAG: nucleoside hydrolase [Eubacteriales bacterium]|nr:nucleoside hydrolase [Eubacteriales bacterium]
MFDYDFIVPENKKIRLLIHTDCKNEADDQFALAHHLMTPKFITKGIIAGHFDYHPQEYGKGQTVNASYAEILKILDLMGLADEYLVTKGACSPLENETTPIPSAGAEMIIREALNDNPLPLYVVFQGSLTDLASALLIEPAIADRLTAIWIGGGKWPDGGFEFNLLQDIHAANVVMHSHVSFWQVPINVYKQIAVSLAELQVRVKPCGALGQYLFQQMVDFNIKLAGYLPWPHGESWGLGDQGTVTVLLEELERMNYDMRPAPRITPDMHYLHDQDNRFIRVYHTLDSRLTMEDFYAKLTLNFGKV